MSNGGPDHDILGAVPEWGREAISGVARGYPTIVALIGFWTAPFTRC